MIYTQHILTPQEIRREQARNAAIARNRAKSVRSEDKDLKDIFIKDPSLNATDAQKGRIRALLAVLRRVDSATWETASPWTLERIDRINMGEASEIIDRIKLRIKQAEERPAITAAPDSPTTASMRPVIPSRDRFSDVQDGYYAVMTEDGVLAFYRVSTWPSGDRKVQVQASDALHRLPGRAAVDGVLNKVREATPPIAGKRYADHLGNCWKCGRTLTDAESRARGVGPVCVNK